MSANDLPVIVIGAGGHGQVLIEALQLLGRRILSVTDSARERLGDSLSGSMIEGSDELVLEHDPNHIELVNAVGSVAVPEIRRRIYNKFVARGYHFATVVHPSAHVADSAVLAQGAQIMAGATVQSRAIIGANTIVNSSASVDHDSTLGMHTHIAPGVVLSGNVCVGQSCHIGTSASVIQAVEIGSYSFVAAGSVVTADLPRGSNVRGVPAKPFAVTGQSVT